jgi:DNA-binding LacI/PurR family transcriptional regulator
MLYLLKNMITSSMQLMHQSLRIVGALLNSAANPFFTRILDGLVDSAQYQKVIDTLQSFYPA